MDTTTTTIDRNTLRMLVQQLAVARLDGQRDLARATCRALRAAKARDLSNLDNEAAECIQRARECAVLYVADESELEELEAEAAQ